MPRIEYLLHPIDTLRTAPVGFALTSLGITLGYESVGEIISNPNVGVKAASLVQFGFEAFLAKGGTHMVAGQFRLRRRLERNIKRRGFDPRIMEPTTRAFCDSQ